jgi:hypothetical protein
MGESKGCVHEFKTEVTKICDGKSEQGSGFAEGHAWAKSVR